MMTFEQWDEHFRRDLDTEKCECPSRSQRSSWYMAGFSVREALVATSKLYDRARMSWESRVLNRLDTMNWFFGKGDIDTIHFREDGRSGYVTIRCPYLKPENARFRIRGDTVHFRKHQSSLAHDFAIR